MRRGAVGTVLGAVLFVAGPFVVPAGAQSQAPDQAAPPSAGDVIPDHYIVTLETTKASKVPEKADQLEERYDAKVDDVYKHALKGFSAEMSADEAARMADDPAVKAVEPDRVVHAVGSQPNPPWGLDRVDQAQPAASNNIYNYATTGDRRRTPTSSTRASARRTRTSRARVGRAPTRHPEHHGSDCNGHGTHVAGTIGGE